MLAKYGIALLTLQWQAPRVVPGQPRHTNPHHASMLQRYIREGKGYQPLCQQLPMGMENVWELSINKGIWLIGSMSINPH